MADLQLAGYRVNLINQLDRKPAGSQTRAGGMKIIHLPNSKGAEAEGEAAEAALICQ